MKDQTGHSVHRIVEIIDRLRAPNGCPWDRRQEREDVGRYLLEEVYEVIDAIDQGSPDGLKEELGDVLFQILFLAKMAEEKGEFTISDVVNGISEKMIFRHPHVFENAQALDVGGVRANFVEKIEEELAELKEAIENGRKNRIEGEIGDLFLSLVNLCRFVQTNPGDTLRSSLEKFAARFSFIEESLKKEGRFPQGATMEEMDLLWNAAKETERDR
ncbi:MAG: nucleoside triphosphate pyrophosphohydrolase [Deltaproteobacteria bacterium]|nr:nucleoside triphosphate pyrophosphohydrolase [Deltaproteobacteria bacterium]